jgi:hypothetical protein
MPTGDMWGPGPERRSLFSRTARANKNKWVRRRDTTLKWAGGVFLLLIVIGVIEGDYGASPSNSTTSNPSVATTTTNPSSNSNSTFSFKDANGNPYNVTLIVLYDPISGENQYITPNAGFRFVGAEFRIRDTGNRKLSDNANLKATVIGQNGQTYAADFDSLSGCTNFNSGEYQLNPGEYSTGCVAFQVPVGVKVSRVEWSPIFGSGSEFGTWNVK